MQKKSGFGFRMILILAAAVLASGFLLCGCTEIKLTEKAAKDALIQIDESVCTRNEAVFFLMEEKAVYENGQSPADLWQRTIGSETMSDYVKDIVKNRLIRYASAEVMSDRLGTYPSEEAKAAAGEEAVASWAKISALYDTDAYGITIEDVHDLYYKKAVYEAVYARIAEDATVDITEESTRVMLADYVFIPKEAGEDAAVQIYNNVKSGMDFSEACAQAGYSLLTGQQIVRGDLNSAVEQVAFALKDGENSEVIESKDGYYLMHCVDDMLLLESAEYYNEVLMAAREEAFNQAYIDFSKEEKLYFDSKYWDQIDIGSIQ